MAGIWVRAGTVTLTNGSKKVTGYGTAWNTGTNKVTKGCAFIYNNIEYEVDYINSDTELYLVDTYGGTTGSGLSYRIQIAVTDTIPELASRIATALAYWNGQAANLQALTTGSGNVTLTAPDGTQVVVPAYSSMQPKDTLLTALAALTTAADKLVYFTGSDTVNQTTLTAFARTVLDDTDAAAMLATLGVTKASTTETNSRLATDRVVTPAGLNAVVPYTPTVNPSLDLDFSKQKYKYYAGANGLTETSDMKSLITFTRSTIATYFDAMGVMKPAAANQPRIDYDPSTGECKGLLIEESRTNLLNYSSSLDTTTFAKVACSMTPNYIIAPDGTLTACRLITYTTISYHRIYLGVVSFTAGTTYTQSVYAKYDNFRYLVINGNAAIAASVVFDLSTGVVANTISGSGAITYCGNGWYRCSITGVAKSTQSSQVFIGVNLTAADGSCLGDGLTGVYLWGTQLEAGAFPTSYIPSTDTWTARASTATYLDSTGVLQTAASGVARSAAYDYDSEGVLRPIGLLLENAATNLLTYSEQFDNAAWTKAACTITANATTAPDGNTTADKIVEDTTTAMHWTMQSATISASTTYTYSFYAKASGRTFTRAIISIGSTTYEAYINLSTGTVGSYTAGMSVYTKKAANGFYRCCLTVTTGSSATTLSCWISPATADGTYNYLGDGASGIYVWGAQLAAGNYATSYIQTTSSQVTRAADTSTSTQTTRAADSAVISGTNFSQWYKQYEGTLVGEEYLPDTNVSDSQGYGRGLAVIHDNTDNSRVMLATSVTNSTIIKNGVTQADIQVGSVAQGKHKAAIAFKNNSVQAAFDGATGTEDTVASIPYLSYLSLGQSAYSSGKLNGHIRSLKYFPKTLTAAELKAMTA